MYLEDLIVAEALPSIVVHLFVGTMSSSVRETSKIVLRKHSLSRMSRPRSRDTRQEPFLTRPVRNTPGTGLVYARLAALSKPEPQSRCAGRREMYLFPCDGQRSGSSRSKLIRMPARMRCLVVSVHSRREQERSLLASPGEACFCCFSRGQASVLSISN